MGGWAVELTAQLGGRVGLTPDGRINGGSFNHQSFTESVCEDSFTLALCRDLDKLEHDNQEHRSGAERIG